MINDLPPLTEPEQEFAEKNHHIIKKYLNIRKLPFDEWYDVVIFRYLRSVHRWFTIPELQQYKFETIAFQAMRSAIGGELEKQKRRIKTISLDEPIPGTDDLTYQDIVTADNLNYLYCVGDDEMNVKFNVKVPERKMFKGWAKSDETIAIEGFLAGKMKNMCFEYDTPEEAKKKLGSVQALRRKENHQAIYDAFRNENCIYIVRKEAANE